MNASLRMSLDSRVLLQLWAKFFFNYGENSSTLPTQIERGTTQKGYNAITLDKKRSKRRISFTFSEICRYFDKMYQ